MQLDFYKYENLSPRILLVSRVSFYSRSNEIRLNGNKFDVNTRKLLPTKTPSVNSTSSLRLVHKLRHASVRRAWRNVASFERCRASYWKLSKWTVSGSFLKLLPRFHLGYSVVTRITIRRSAPGFPFSFHDSSRTGGRILPLHSRRPQRPLRHTVSDHAQQ